MVLKKSVHYLFFCCLQGLILLSWQGYAQELPTAQLKPVEIHGQRLSRFAIGAKTTFLDSTLIDTNALPNLAELISNYTSTAVKSYGNGMLSTISFRGTGPSHTAVLWHGINIGYPMLGQSDLSLLSMALSNTVTIQNGTGSALYGSGALGGTLSLASTDPLPGRHLLLSQWAGSFGIIKNNIQASFANDKYYVSVRTLWDQAENNFFFENSTKPGLPVEEQQGAAYKMFGTALESGVNVGKKSKILLSAQYLMANRDLQPSMNANFPANNQTDENIRVRTGYVVADGMTNWSITYAYLHDVIGFNGDKTFADQQLIRAEIQHNLYFWLSVNMAADYNNIQIRSPFYATNKTNENRSNIWGSFLVTPLERLVISLNLRQSFNPDYTIPFTPSLGAEYLLLDKSAHQLKIKTQVAKGFRVPTLNERFWQPGGNQSLVPEESYSAELGFSGQIEKEVAFSYEITGYRMWVDNWILWRPQGSFWAPENIKYVDVYGVELTESLKHDIDNIKQKWLANYAFTKSINRTGLDQFDRSVNKQLSYVPVHKASFTSISQLNTWSLIFNVAFTGERFITADNESSLPGYTLLNIRLGKSFRKGKYLFSGYANVNNVFNTSYQSIENKAMPGINYLLGITVSYYKP